MKEEIVYTRLELYEATEDIISGIRSGISKYWSSKAEPTFSTKKVTPDTKIVLNQADLTSAYKYMRDILLNLFFKQGNYKTDKTLRFNIFNQIDNIFFKANVKANEIFLKLNEQQKKTSNISVGSGKTRVPRITFDISSILKAQKFDTLPIEQQEEIKTLLVLWIEEISKKFNKQNISSTLASPSKLNLPEFLITRWKILAEIKK